MNSLDSAFFRGRVACANQEPKTANPHPAESHEHAQWDRGWLEEYGTLPRELQVVRDGKAATYSA